MERGRGGPTRREGERGRMWGGEGEIERVGEEGRKRWKDGGRERVSECMGERV